MSTIYLGLNDLKQLPEFKVQGIRGGELNAKCCVMLLPDADTFAMILVPPKELIQAIPEIKDAYDDHVRIMSSDDSRKKQKDESATRLMQTIFKAEKVG
jgi:hypothetical protein